MEYLKKDCIKKDRKLIDAISTRHMTGWDQARKEYLSKFQIPITPGHYMKPFETQRVEDFRMTGSPELTPCGTKFLREFNFTNGRFFVFCGN